MDVYKTINAVHSDLAKIGIAKKDKNEYDNYAFRGIDAVYNAVSPILAKHGLLILQRVLSCETSQRQSSRGGVLFNSVVDVEFDLISSSDGSKHTIKTFGEGMDRSDKSINKALTAAYKYALFQAFCIPVEGSSDADKDSHSVAPYTDKQLRDFRACLDHDDGMALALFVRDTDNDVLTALYNSFPPNKISSSKAKVQEMISSAHKVVDEYMMGIREAVENNDLTALIEYKNELDTTTKKLLKDKLSEKELKALRSVKGE